MFNQLRLNLLKQKILSDLDCPLKDAAKNLVFGKGNLRAKIVFIGEAPGKNEDVQGIPFVGRAGNDLNKLLNSINLSLDDVYICNILKYRPPKNRDPSPLEIKSHTPYLIKQLEIIKPKLIITLGNYATKFVLSGFSPDKMNKIQGVSKLHSKPHKIKFGKKHLTVIPFYHPSAMIYNPKVRSILQEDFVSLGTFLNKKF